MIFRALKKLEGVVSMSKVEPLMLEKGWTFAAPDPLTGALYVHQIYQRAEPKYSGRASVPVLWDKETNTIVNNESSEIIRMFNREFRDFTDDKRDYYPAGLKDEIDAVNRRVYEGFNNGVYRAGFATTQTAYEAAVKTVFETLDWLEALLSGRRCLVGDRLTEADWRLFPTLARFDAVYFGHFKCNLRRLTDYPTLSAYARRLYGMPGIAATCDFDEYKRHYYGSHRTINPTGIVPLGPLEDFRKRRIEPNSGVAQTRVLALFLRRQGDHQPVLQRHLRLEGEALLGARRSADRKAHVARPGIAIDDVGRHAAQSGDGLGQLDDRGADAGADVVDLAFGGFGHRPDEELHHVGDVDEVAHLARRRRRW